MTNSTFSDNTASGKQGAQGGGIDNDGKLTVTDSTISNNSVNSSDNLGAGGGIYNYQTGTVMVTGSIFSHNSASGKQYGLGGGISSQGNLTAVNSTLLINTVSGGQSYGGAIELRGSKGSSTLIRFSTLYANTASTTGGGISIDPAGSNLLTISGSIIAANSSSVGPDIFGALTSGGYNLIENAAGAKGLNASTDKQVTLTELMVSPTLSNNGGPTQTLALFQGSPAIDAVPLQACSFTITDASGQSVKITTDQRGDPRPDGSENACDVGAYESSYQA